MYWGVRQGCPILPVLFNLVIEMMAIAIMSDKKIQGLNITLREYKLAHYTDNAILID